MANDRSPFHSHASTETATIFARNAAKYLSIFTLFLCAMHVLSIPAYVYEVDNPGTYMRIMKYFNLNSEYSIPAWFSVNLLSMNMLGLIINGIREARTKNFLSWMIMAAVFGLLSLDEMISIHEKIGGIISSWHKFGGFLTYAWIIPGSAFTIIFALTFLGFLLRLPRRTAFLFLLAGAIYVGGAVVIEAIGGYSYSVEGMDALYYLLVLIEESMEMFGQILFGYALLEHLALIGSNFRIRVSDS